MWKRKRKDDPAAHIMELVVEHPTGWREHYCPDCGRRFITHVLGPGKVMLNYGNSKITHVYRVDEQNTADDDSLKPWKDFLDGPPS